MKQRNYPLSYEIAEKSGLFHWVHGESREYLRPTSDADVAEYFGHDKHHNTQSYVLKANKPDTDALVIGGSRYSLLALAQFLEIDLRRYDVINTKQSRTRYNVPVTIHAQDYENLKQFLKSNGLRLGSIIEAFCYHFLNRINLPHDKFLKKEAIDYLTKALSKIKPE